MKPSNARLFRRATIAGVAAALVAGVLAPVAASAAPPQKPVSTTYFVDAAAGNDAAPGTSQKQPWKTLDKVNASTFKPGDTVKFRGGQTWQGGLHVTSSGTASAPVTFTSYGSGRPLIEGGTTVDAGILLENASYVTVAGFEVTNGLDRSVAKPDTFRGIHAIAKDVGEVAGVVIKDNYVHAIDGKGGPVIGRGGISVGVRGNAVPTWFSDLRIENNEVGDVNAYGISTFTTWCAGCEIYSHETGIPSSEVSKTRQPFTRTVIRDNYVHDVTAGGITPQYVDDGLVEGNTVVAAGSHLLGDYGNNAGIWWQGTKRMTVQFNVVRKQGYDHFRGTEPVDGMAFDADMGTSDSVVQYNYSYSNAGGFFMCLISANNNTVRYNVSRDDTFRTFSLWAGCSNTRIYNNTVWGTADPITRVNADGSTYEQEMESIVRNQGGTVGFTNNIFVNPARAPFGGNGDQQISYAHNLYWDDSGEPVVPAADGQPIVADPQLAAPDQDVPEGKIDRPTLMKLLGAYAPATDSPARNAGVSVSSAPAVDALGTAVPAGAPDLGAIQHGVKVKVKSKSGSNPDALTDGDLGTVWTQTRPDSSISLDFREARRLDGLHLAVPANADFTVTVTADGSVVADGVRVTGSADPTWFRVPFASAVDASSVRIDLHSDAGDASVSEIRGTFGAAAVATAQPGGAASTDLGTSSGTIQAINDGNMLSSWASGNSPRLPGTVTVAYAEPQTIDGVQIGVAFGQGQGPTLVDVQTKAADGTWQTQVADHQITWNLNSTTAEAPVIAFPATVEAHGIRLVVKQANLWWGHLAIYEFAGALGGTPVYEPQPTTIPDVQDAVDGDPATTWVANADGSTGLQAYPGAPQTVRSITVTSPEDLRPTTVRVRAFSNGTWTDRTEPLALEWNGDSATVELPAPLTGTTFDLVFGADARYGITEVTLVS